MQPIQPIHEQLPAMTRTGVPIDSRRAEEHRPVYYAVVLVTRGVKGQASADAGPPAMILGPYLTETTARFMHVSAYALGLADSTDNHRPN